MLKNEKQYQVTQRKRLEFIEALATMKEYYRNDPEEFELRARFIQAQIDILDEEIIEYEKLKERKIAFLSVPDFAKIAELLIKGRIVKNWTQSDLASRLDIKEQQVQRYESTDYETASLARVVQVFKALDLDMQTCKVTFGEPNYVIPVTAKKREMVKEAFEKARKHKQLIVIGEV